MEKSLLDERLELVAKNIREAYALATKLDKKLNQLGLLAEFFPWDKSEETHERSLGTLFIRPLRPEGDKPAEPIAALHVTLNEKDQLHARYASGDIYPGSNEEENQITEMLHAVTHGILKHVR